MGAGQGAARGHTGQWAQPSTQPTDHYYIIHIYCEKNLFKSIITLILKFNFNKRTSWPYFRVKLSCVFLLFALRKKRIFMFYVSLLNTRNRRKKIAFSYPKVT